MKKDILFTLPSYFRDDMSIMAYRFGKGEKTCAVVGALRGDEVQQLYVCARLVSFLREVQFMYPHDTCCGANKDQ